MKFHFDLDSIACFGMGCPSRGHRAAHAESSSQVLIADLVRNTFMLRRDEEHAQ